jgi:hypothetical protein
LNRAPSSQLLTGRHHPATPRRPMPTASIAAIARIDKGSARPSRGGARPNQRGTDNRFYARFYATPWAHAHTERPDTLHGQLRVEPQQPRANPPGGLPDGYGKHIRDERGFHNKAARHQLLCPCLQRQCFVILTAAITPLNCRQSSQRERRAIHPRYCAADRQCLKPPPPQRQQPRAGGYRGHPADLVWPEP